MSPDATHTLRGRLATLPVAALAQVATALEEIGAEVVAEARRSLAADGPTQPDPGKRPASAPGGPPDDPTGRLAASLGVVADPAAAHVTVAASTPYAIFLEYGTRHMAARPFLRPAVEAHGEAARSRLAEALRRAVASALGGAA
jgi:HK97 gp10 family phage protein